jgi:hypothetical protein
MTHEQEFKTKEVRKVEESKNTSYVETIYRKYFISTSLEGGLSSFNAQPL